MKETSQSTVDKVSASVQSQVNTQNWFTTKIKTLPLFIYIVMGLLSVSFAIVIQFYYFGSTYSASQSPMDLTPSLGYESVTFNSLIKLTHTQTQFRLHSQEAKYGSGSGQQVVSGLEEVDNPESYWVVYPSFNSELAPAGTPIKCGDIIGLKHSTTGAFLHSHHFPSPLSGGLEVSGFGGHDSGDNWKVICKDSQSETWKREKDIKLQHINTGKYLTSNRKNMFPQPISGQLEVYTTSTEDNKIYWKAQEGIYFPEIGKSS